MLGHRSGYQADIRQHLATDVQSQGHGGHSSHPDRLGNQVPCTAFSRLGRRDSVRRVAMVRRSPWCPHGSGEWRHRRQTCRVHRFASINFAMVMRMMRQSSQTSGDRHTRRSYSIRRECGPEKAKSPQILLTRSGSSLRLAEEAAGRGEALGE